MLFLVVTDWITQKTTQEGNIGIQWTLTKRLEDLDFADNLVLLSQSIVHMRRKGERLETNAARLGPRINATITKEMRVKTTSKTRSTETADFSR